MSVFQRDYILRLVEQLAKTLVGIVALRKARRLQEAGTALTEAAKNFVGLDVETLLALPVEQIVTLLSPGGVLDPAKAIVVAELLAEKGELSALEEEEAVAYRARLRALGLLLELSAREGLARVPDADRLREKIDDLSTAIGGYGYDLVPEIETRRIKHYEREGHYAAADDTIFELVEAGHPEILDEAVAFYERLLEKSDDELRRGQLPRDEVEESLAELRRRGEPR